MNNFSIIEYLDRIIKRQKKIGYNMPLYIRPGLSLEEIRRFESRYNFEFNDSFCSYFKYMDGVENPNEENGFSLTLIPTLFRLISISKLESFIQENAFADLQDNYISLENTSSLHFPILFESHANCYWVNLDATDENYGSILRTTMWGEADIVFSSIEKLFETICLAYEKNIIRLEGNQIKIDFSEYGEIARIVNPKNLYWQSYR